MAVVPGNAFGAGGGFVRCCYATSYEKIEEALSRMERFMRRHGYWRASRNAGRPASIEIRARAAGGVIREAVRTHVAIRIYPHSLAVSPWWCWAPPVRRSGCAPVWSSPFRP